MLHLKNTSCASRNAAELLIKARKLIESGGLVVRDARVSKNYVEFDISIPEEQRECIAFEKLTSIAPLVSVEEVVERHIPKEEAINLAIKSFNDEKYWNAHELLEGVWKSAHGEEKRILNGVILVAAAFVHDEKAESEICIPILRRALAKLEGSRGKYSGIDIDLLVGLLQEIISSGKITRFTI